MNIQTRTKQNTFWLGKNCALYAKTSYRKKPALHKFKMVQEWRKNDQKMERSDFHKMLTVRQIGPKMIIGFEASRILRF